jgi:cbb3-type cytochrome oxidase subunit 3
MFIIILIMQTIILLSLVIVIVWVLFRPITKKELDRYNNKDNWPNMDLH